MKLYKLCAFSLVIVAATISADVAHAAMLTIGNLVVSRVGSGSAVLDGTATAVFLDEYTTAGVPVGNTIAVPTASSGSNFALTIGGTATSQGQLTLAANKKSLLLAGYDAPPGTTGPASNANFRGRTVALVNNLGNVDTTTRFELAGTTMRAATSSNGVDIWTSSDVGSNVGGLLHVPYGTTNAANTTRLNATTTNIRVPNIFNGQLYMSSSTGVGGDYRGVSSVGTGLPTTAGQTYTLLSGMGGSNSGFTDSTYDFFFADSNTVYLADDDTAAPSSGGLQKWTLNAGTWSKQWTVNLAGATGVRSLAGAVAPTGAVTIYAITSETSTSAATRLVTLTDTGSVVPPTFTVLATAPTNTTFRGVDFAPVPEPGSLTLLAIAAASIMSTRRRR